MDRNARRPLLPALSRSPAEAPNPLTGSVKKRRRQHLTRVACNVCRTRKAACDGLRPSCSACQHRNEHCVYVSKDELETSSGALKRENEALKAKSRMLEDLINLMNSKPNLPARLILQKLEPVSDLHADPLSLPTQSPDRLLSEQKIAREPLYDKPSECEAGLMVQHNPSFDASDRNDFPSDPFANPYYVAQLNNQGNLLRMDHDLTPNSQCFGDSLYNSDEEAAGGGSAFPKGTTNASDSSEARLFDPRLAALNISFWTMVTISDYDAANIISQFLYQDLPIFAVLKPHLLVASLVEKRLDFCSSFLVNSLLALGSQLYAAQGPELSIQSLMFEKEAIELLQIENSLDSLTTVAGLVFLALALSNCAQGPVGKHYLDQALEMAGRLKLFNLPERIGVENLGRLVMDEQRANLHVTWGTFNCLA